MNRKIVSVLQVSVIPPKQINTIKRVGQNLITHFINFISSLEGPTVLFHQKSLANGSLLTGAFKILSLGAGFIIVSTLAKSRISGKFWQVWRWRTRDYGVAGLISPASWFQHHIRCAIPVVRMHHFNLEPVKKQTFFWHVWGGISYLRFFGQPSSVYHRVTPTWL